MALKMDHLAAYGIEQEVIEIWKERYGEALLPLQEQALRESRLLQGQNLLILAPSSSGKTFIGELMALLTVHRKQRVFYLVPSKALAEEKYAQFQEAYAPLGIRTVIATRERQEFEADLEAGRFHIAILGVETLQPLLVKRPGLLEEVGLLVVDELQMIADPELGPTLESILTQVRLARPGLQILGLSAVFGEPQELAKWLKADLLVSERRPVELQKGILCRGLFRYIEQSSKGVGEERWFEPEEEREEQAILRATRYLSEELGEPTLLFFRDQALAEMYARKLAEAVDLPPAKEAIAELKSQEETITRDLLIGLLQKGVGLHHADLPWEQRELIERTFRQGEIRILCSTSTLAMDLNLPAKNVIIDVKRWRRVKPFQELGLSDITKGEYEGLSGRAGRFGLVEGFGRAILVTTSPFEAEVWKRFYLEGPLEKLTPSLSTADLGPEVLHLIASGFCRTLMELKTFFRSTFTGSTAWQGESGERALESALAEEIGLFVKEGLIFKDDRGRLHPTELGRVAAQNGMTVETCLMMLRWLDEAIPSGTSELEILMMLALTEDGQAVSLPLTEAEHRGDRYRRHLRQEVLEAGEEGKLLFQRFLTGAGWLADEEQASRKVLLLSHWIGPMETSKIERHFETPSGAIRRVGRRFRWLAGTLAELARAKGWPQAAVERVERLSQRLRDRLPEEGLPYAKLCQRGLGRGAIGKLMKRDYQDPEVLQDSSLKALRQVLPEKLTGDLSREVGVKPRQGCYRPEVLIEEAQVREATPPYHACKAILLIDRSHPGTVRWEEQTLVLTSKQFRQLVALAEAPGQCVPYERLYQRMWPDGTAVEPQQIHYHKAQLLKRFKQVLPPDRAKALITVVAGEGLVLNLRPDEVVLR